MSEIKLKQEVIDSIQERIDKECYFVGEEWVISSDEALEIVADVLQKTMERILTRLEEKKQEYLEGFRVHQENELYGIACGFGDSIKIVKEVGGIDG